jgi:hypothetical protein
MGQEAAQATEPSIEEVLPCLVGVAQDETGIRFLRMHLPEAPKEVHAMVFGATISELEQLCLHRFGHVLVLQVLEIATAEQSKVLSQLLCLHAKKFSLDQHGCRVMQKALQVMPQHLRDHLVESLKEIAVICMSNMHGSQVMQVCLEEDFAATCPNFVIDAIEDWGADAAAADMYAFRFVTQLLERAQRHQLEGIMQQILVAVPQLAHSRFGNCVVQHIIEKGELADKRSVLSKILPLRVTVLAKHKYAHNVVKRIVEVVCSSEFEFEAEYSALKEDFHWQHDGSKILTLCSDRYGVKVVECLADNLTDSDLDQLVFALHEAEATSLKLPFAEAVFAKLKIAS